MFPATGYCAAAFCRLERRDIAVGQPDDVVFMICLRDRPSYVRRLGGKELKLAVYAALCPEGAEHDLAYRLLALAAERELGLHPLPEIAREVGGKPFFPGCPEICFNLSHSHGAAVCALHDKPVGIDVEKLRPAPKRLASGMENEAFFRLWTAKEATVKRWGQGIGALLRPLEPDPLCLCVEGLLEGYVVTVCPSEDTEIRAVRIE